MLWERFLFLSSVSASLKFSPQVTLFFAYCRQVGGSRKTASRMSAKHLYEQTMSYTSQRAAGYGWQGKEAQAAA